MRSLFFYNLKKDNEPCGNIYVPYVFYPISAKGETMNNFIFENATKVYFGKGCVKEYLSCFVEKYGKRVMIAYGGGSIKKNGIYDEVIAILEHAGAQTVEFCGIMANPTYEKVLEGAKLAKEHKADWILGVGGGSVMDCCKAVSMATVGKKDIWDNYWAKTGIVDQEEIILSVIQSLLCSIPCIHIVFL